MTKEKTYEILCGAQILHLSERTHIMGVLNVTPDSFSDGGKYLNKDKAVLQASAMINEGADIIDIGGESTRPGAQAVSVSEEIKRIIPVIEEIRKQYDVPISIDTMKSEVAEEAIKAGANIVNDVSCFHFDSQMPFIVAKNGVPVILMHMKGMPKTMQENPQYVDIIQEIIAFLNNGIKLAVKSGISRDKIIVDPGIGFGKKWDENFLILNQLKQFKKLNCPILIGVSRKSFIGRALDVSENDRLMGTAAAVTAGILNGSHIIRVHDVKEMKQVMIITDHIRQFG